jgi:hypothetical protein
VISLTALIGVLANETAFVPRSARRSVVDLDFGGNGWAKRPKNIATPVVTLYQGVFALSPANAEPLSAALDRQTAVAVFPP